MTATTVAEEVLLWVEALGSGTWWSRRVGRRAARPGRTAAEDRLTQRLTRYTAPSSTDSMRGVAGYSLDQLSAT